MNDAGRILITQDDALLFYSQNKAKTVMLLVLSIHLREKAVIINVSVNRIIWRSSEKSRLLCNRR